MASPPPNYPSLNQQWDYNGIIYTWNGNIWVETDNTNNSFNQTQINGVDVFNSFKTRNINFQGINLVIYSGGVNTLVFSAQQQTNSSSTFSGGTVSGPTNFTNGLSANTIYATTYQNLPINTLTAGQNINISGTSGNLTISFTGTTGSSFTGGTVSGPTNFTSGLTATTISATTYQNLPATPFLPLSGGTITGNVLINSPFSTTQKALTVFSQNTSESVALYGLAGRGTNAYGVYCDVSPSAEFYTITNGIGGYFNVGGQFSEGEPTNKYSLQLIDGTEGVGKVLTSVTSDGKANWVTPRNGGSDLYLFYNY
jgi:hypothetical protein